MKFDHEKLEVCEISIQSWKTHHRERHNHLPAPARSSASARNRNTVKIENRYRYTSREFVETNLYYYRARHMRPDLGRFISMDPLKMIDGTNMFGYVGSSPIMWVDPLGKKSACGSLGLEGIIPDSMAGVFDFNSACVAHDKCYGTCGSGKADCDKIFYGSMLRHCRTKYMREHVVREACERKAKMYYDGVRLGGLGSYA